jgi:hypothetical protein
MVCNRRHRAKENHGYCGCPAAGFIASAPSRRRLFEVGSAAGLVFASGTARAVARIGHFVGPTGAEAIAHKSVSSLGRVSKTL